MLQILIEIVFQIPFWQLKLANKTIFVVASNLILEGVGEIYRQSTILLLLTRNMFYLFQLQGNLLVNKTELQALYLSGTYCHKTGTRPPCCNTPREPTIHGEIKNSF